MVTLGLSDYTPTTEKALPSGAVINRAGTDQARAYARASADVATGVPPDPGPLPAAGESDRWPLRWQFPLGTNQIYTPRAGSLTKFDTLRGFADLCDIVRIAIEARKDQLVSLDWDFSPKDPKKPNDKGVAVAREFFKKPDKRRNFKTWLKMAIEDVLVIDALSIYRRRTRGGQLFALEIKDGTTFKPLLDDNGDTPLPPDIAYRQIIYGQPVDGGDCTTDDLLYRPRAVRAQTPYGLSPTEAVILTVNAAMNRELFNLAYYADGNVPAGLVDTPQGWTAQQLREFQDYWDTLFSGNLGQKRRIKFVPNGTAQSLRQFAEPNWDTKYDEWLLKVIAASFGVPPSELGFTADVNRATAKQQESVVYRRGVKPLANYFKDIFDEVLADDLGLDDIEAIYTHGEAEDRLKQAQADLIYVNMGKLSIDELRQRDGEDLIGLGPYIMTSTGPVFVEELIAGVDDDPTTTDVEAPPPQAGAPPAPAPPQDAAADQAQADLKRWKAVALKAVKAGRPIKAFASVAIPGGAQRTLRAALEHATSVEAVVEAFDAIEKAQALNRKQIRAHRTFKRFLNRHFTAQGKALAAHLKAGVEARA